MKSNNTEETCRRDGPGPEPPHFVDAPLGLKFRLIHERFKHSTNEEMQQYDLTYSQMWILWYLHMHEGERINQKELCVAAKVKHPTMVGLVRRMEAKGLITLENDPNDRRQNFVRITDRTKEIMDRQREDRKARDAALVKGFSEAEVDQLNNLLERVYNNLEADNATRSATGDQYAAHSAEGGDTQ